MVKRTPELAALHRRHFGLSRPVCESYAEAASVCLSRHHESPVEIVIYRERIKSESELVWEPPDERSLRAWANVDDATRDGAYSVALAVVESELGLVAVSRAETRTGADYYIGPPEGVVDLENCYRLEVSGADKGSVAELKRRLAVKIAQALRGQSDLPAFAVVVGFREKCVMLEVVEMADA